MSSRRRLSRSRTDRKIGGVAGGIAEYFGLDATLVRIIWVLLLILPPAGLVPYLILWIALPEADAGSASSAVAIAEERFARGEIDAAELGRIRQDLGR